MFDEGTRLRQNWELESNCYGMDPEYFHPKRGEDIKPIKEVCVGCDVKAECLVTALRRSDKIGIKGGLSGNERRELLRKLKTKKKIPDTA